jgi:hypothetical protein
VIALGTGTFASKDAVRIDGDLGDKLNLTGGNWSLQEASGTPSGYSLYVHTASGQGDAYALVQQQITVNLA